jgi:hypothetical protein
MNRLAIPSAVASGPVGARAIDRRKTGINSTPGVSPTTQSAPKSKAELMAVSGTPALPQKADSE